MPKMVDDLHVQGAASIQAAADKTSQVVKQAAGQQVPLMEFEDSNGNILAAVHVDGSNSLSGYMRQVMTDKPVGYWPLNDPAGSAVAKGVVGGDGTPSGGVTFGASGALDSDANQTAASFDGTASTAIHVPFDASFNTGSAVTMEAWVNPSVVTTMDILAKGGNAGYRFYLGTASNILFAGNATWNELVSPNNEYVLNEWQHIVGVADASGFKLYLNAQLIASNSTAFAPTDTTSGIFIGAETASNEPFKGKIAHVAVYNKALSADRIAAHYAAGKPFRSLTQILTASGTVTAPPWATCVRVKAKGGGGGAGGSGSAATTGGVTSQAPGSPGGCGGYADVVMPCAGGDVFNVTIGAGGSAGTSGAAGGNPGTNGSSGGTTTIQKNGATIVEGMGGGQGAGSGANSTSGVSVGMYGYPGMMLDTVSQPIPGCGGVPNYPSLPGPDGWCAGSGAGSATATNGGGAGICNQTIGASGHGMSGTSSTADGQDVSPGPVPNSGTGGAPGGAGAPGGRGGNGTAGASGYAVFEFRSA